AGATEADHLERRSLALHIVAKLREQLLRVLDWVALGELVGLADDLAVLAKEHGLRGGRAAVEADDPAHDLPGLELHGDEFRDRVQLAERRGFGGRAHERRAGRLAEARL